MTVSILEPPYRFLVPLGGARPGLGSVLLADLREGIPALAAAVSAHLDAPWCPLALLLPDRSISAQVLATFEPVPATWAPLYPTDYAHLGLPGRVIAAVRRRPVPQPTVVGLWLERRLRRPAIAGTLATCMGEGADTQPPPRTLTRRVGALGPLEVRDWRGLGGLVRVLAGGAPGLSLEAQAYLAELDPRTLRRWLRLATALPWSEVSRRVGWEWLLESAMRRVEHVERSVVMPGRAALEQMRRG